ncbi:hypothetical protein X975_16460, partial [Stegodyphus mimosarum]
MIFTTAIIIPFSYLSHDMLKHLSCKSLNALLTLYNRAWKEHTFPSAWRRAVVIPIAKPG